MGREAAAQISYQGQTGAAKILLEGPEVLCRGAVRLRLPRAEILTFAVQGADLVLTTAQGDLRATMAPGQAALWSAALSRPLPDLAAKLGVSAQNRAFAASDLQDADLRAALQDRLAPADQASVAVAEVLTPADLGVLLARIGPLPLWVVTVKGKDSPCPEAQLRPLLRARGYVDTKSCAVSARMTATRWQKRQAKAPPTAADRTAGA